MNKAYINESKRIKILALSREIHSLNRFNSLLFFQFFCLETKEPKIQDH